MAGRPGKKATATRVGATQCASSDPGRYRSMRGRSNLVSVLDLGSTKAVFLAAEPDGAGGLEIRGFATADCKGLRRGIVNDLDETASAIDNVIRRVQQMAGEDIQ